MTTSTVGHSSVVEHLTADQEVTGSNSVGPLFFLLFVLVVFNEFETSKVPKKRKTWRRPGSNWRPSVC
jgi:hypothetical protein